MRVRHTPISVRFSRYQAAIPLPALLSTYRAIGAEVIPRDDEPITSSQVWRYEATVYLWPIQGPTLMTWERFAFALSALVDFATTQGTEGFRYDVYFRTWHIGLGSVTAVV